MKSRRWVRMLKFLPFGVLFLAVFGFVVMSLWNWLVPALFGLRAIGYWQALGLVVLSRILFGGRGAMVQAGSWRRRMRDRWEGMTPEERERFRQGFLDRWDRVPHPDATAAE